MRLADRDPFFPGHGTFFAVPDRPPSLPLKPSPPSLRKLILPVSSRQHHVGAHVRGMHSGGVSEHDVDSTAEIIGSREKRDLMNVVIKRAPDDGPNCLNGPRPFFFIP